MQTQALANNCNFNELTGVNAYMLLALTALILGFIGGVIVGVKNANSSKVEKAKQAIDIIKK